MDFKVGDENSDQKIKERNDKITWIIIIVISLIVGIGTFILTSSLLNQNEEIPIPQEEEPLDLSEQNVQILYKYVTYGIRNRRADKFLKESTTLATFTNQERFYYALQFASKNDFSSTGKNNAEGHPIYHITEAKIREYMQRFFGPGVSYTSQVKFPYTFRFTINGKNTGTFQTADGDGYNIVFDKVESNFQKDLVEPLYAKLVSAYKEPDGSYRLVEKVIFTNMSKNNNMYNIYIYKDLAHSRLIATLTNQTDESLRQNPINLDTYLEEAATITYYFNVNDEKLYFEKSTIS